MKKSLVIALIFVLMLPLFAFSGCRKFTTETLPTEYTISAELLPEQSTLNINSAIAFNPTEKSDKLYFYLGRNLPDNAIKFENVTINGKSVEYAFNKGVFSIINGKYKKRNRLLLNLTASITLQDNSVPLGVNNGVYVLADFYPIFANETENKNPENNGDICVEKSNFSVTFTLPKYYEIASAGTQTKVESSANKKVISFALENARNYCAVASKRLVASYLQSGETKINYYYISDSERARTTQIIKQAFTIFSEEFGDYDYHDLSIVNVPLSENVESDFSSFCILNNSLSRAEFNYALVRQIAKMWWQDKVAPAPPCAWLSDALAEYSVAYYYLNIAGENAYKNYISTAENTYETYVNITQILPPITTPKSERTAKENEILRCKSLIIFANLATIVGRENLISVLKYFADNFADKIVSTQDFVQTINRKLGKDYTQFFLRWLD